MKKVINYAVGCVVVIIIVFGMFFVADHLDRYEQPGTVVGYLNDCSEVAVVLENGNCYSFMTDSYGEDTRNKYPVGSKWIIELKDYEDCDPLNDVVTGVKPVQ